ncbi:MAG: ATP-binding protein [Turicibacter sp.]|nr:ATP-binding protein [Turicibacter sp.]
MDLNRHVFKELLSGDEEALAYINRVAKLNSPNGDVYEGKSAEEVLVEIDNKRTYKPQHGYNCPVCGNKGGHSEYNKTTKQIWWTQCECLKHKKNTANTDRSGLGELLKHSVNNFKVTQEFQKKMKEMTICYITKGKKEWLMYLGQSGCGKTMLCSAICNQRLREGKEVKYLLWNEFVDALNSMSNYDKDREKYFTAFANAEILYIDDLFKGTITDHRKDIAFRLINHRYNHDLITIISSELLLEDLAELDEAITGRLYQKTNFTNSKGEEQKYVFEVEKDRKKNYRFNS